MRFSEKTLSEIENYVSALHKQVGLKMSTLADIDQAVRKQRKELKGITFTKKEVQEVVMKAFNKGKNWGVTYSNWFKPTEKQQAERSAKDCEEIYKELLIAKKQNEEF